MAEQKRIHKSARFLQSEVDVVNKIDGENFNDGLKKAIEIARKSMEKEGEMFKVIDKEIRFYYCGYASPQSLSELICVKDPKFECKEPSHYGENEDQPCPLARYKEWRKLIASLSKNAV